MCRAASPTHTCRHVVIQRDIRGDRTVSATTHREQRVLFEGRSVPNARKLDPVPKHWTGGGRLLLTHDLGGSFSFGPRRRLGCRAWRDHRDGADGSCGVGRRTFRPAGARFRPRCGSGHCSRSDSTLRDSSASFRRGEACRGLRRFDARSGLDTCPRGQCRQRAWRAGGTNAGTPPRSQCTSGYSVPRRRTSYCHT